MKTLATRLLFLACIALAFTTCSKDEDKATCSDGLQNQGETGVDCGGPCTACISCSDGIQNQGETGIDCGGPCSPCPTVLCNGNGSNTYQPLAVNDSWTYSNSSGPNQTLTITGMSGSYYVMHNAGGFFTDYLFKTVSGDVVFQFSSADYVWIPGSPVAGNQWSYTTAGDYFKVDSVNVVVNTGSCTYNNCLKINAYDPGNNLMHSRWYKKGIGMVKYTTGPVSLTLNAIQLY